MSNIDNRKQAGMKVILKKYGNTTVAVLPPLLLRDLERSAGQSMTLDINKKADYVDTQAQVFACCFAGAM